MGSSVANLSRFDTDLMSKKMENANDTFPTNAMENMALGGANAKASEGAKACAGEVPLTIRAVGDDVDDDLTEATAATLATAKDFDIGEVGPPRENLVNPSFNNSTEEQAPPAPTTSPFFANAADSQVVAQPGTEQGTTKDVSMEERNLDSPIEQVSTEAPDGNTPPSEEIVIPGITTTNATVPSPSGNLEVTAEPVAKSDAAAANNNEPAAAYKPDSTNEGLGLGGTLSPHQGIAHRVSLSPPPVAGYVDVPSNANQATTFSPKVPPSVPRPSPNTNQGHSLSPKAKGPVPAPGQLSPKGRIEAPRNAKRAPSFFLKGRATGPRRTINGNQTASKPNKACVEAPNPGFAGNQAPSSSPKGATSLLRKGPADSSIGQDAIVIPGIPTVTNNVPADTDTNANVLNRPESRGAPPSLNSFGTDAAATGGTEAFPDQGQGRRDSILPPSCHVNLDLDDNSIVIPGVSDAVANMNVDAEQKMMAPYQATGGLKSPEVGMANFGTNSALAPNINQTMATNNFHILQAPANGVNPQTVANGQMNKNSYGMTVPVNNGGINTNVHNANIQKPSLMPKRNAMMGKSTGAANVQFAVPETRPNSNANGAPNTAPAGNYGVEKNNGASLANPNTNSNGTAAPSSTAITPDHRNKVQNEITPFARRSNGNNTVSPTPQKAQAVEMKIMELQPQIEERRPRSNTMYSPPPSLMHNNSITPKTSNVHTTAVDPNNEAVPASFSTNNSSFHTDETFDELLSQFVQDIQDGTDIYEKGQKMLLDLDVDLSHAFAGVLQYKERYQNLLDEIESIQAMSEAIMAEVSE